MNNKHVRTKTNALCMLVFSNHNFKKYSGKCKIEGVVRSSLINKLLISISYQNYSSILITNIYSIGLILPKIVSVEKLFHALLFRLEFKEF